MSGYFVGNYTVTNQKGYDLYLAQVMPTIEAFDGIVLVGGPVGEAVEGKPGPINVILKFPTLARLREWYFSPEYQAIVHLRTDNVDGTAVLLNGAP